MNLLICVYFIFWEASKIIDELTNRLFKLKFSLFKNEKDQAQ